MKITDKVLKITVPKMPPAVDFIENKIREFSIEPVRWAIIEIDKNELTLSVAGIED